MGKVYKYEIAACGHPSNRSRKECASCARKRIYQVNPTAILETNKRYINANPQKRQEIVRRYKDKYSLRIPDELKELRQACRRLEKALAEANDSERVGRAD